MILSARGAVRGKGYDYDPSNRQTNIDYIAFNMDNSQAARMIKRTGSSFAYDDGNIYANTYNGYYIDFSCDGQYMITGGIYTGNTRYAYVYNRTSGNVWQMIGSALTSGGGTPVSFHPTISNRFAVGEGHRVTIFEVNSSNTGFNQLGQANNPNYGNYTICQWHYSGNYVYADCAYGTYGGQVNGAGVYSVSAGGVPTFVGNAALDGSVAANQISCNFGTGNKWRVSPNGSTIYVHRLTSDTDYVGTLAGNFTSNTGNTVYQTAVSPDGKIVAYTTYNASFGNDDIRLFRLDPSTNTYTHLANPSYQGGARGIAWAPDSSRFYYTTHNGALFSLERTGEWTMETTPTLRIYISSAITQRTAGRMLAVGRPWTV